MAKKTTVKNNPAKSKKAPSKYISATAFAKLVPGGGVSQRRVAQAIKDGILTESVKVSKRGKRNEYKIDPEKALKEWAANIDPAKQRDPEKAAATKNMAGGTSPSSYQKAKAAGEVYKSKILALEYGIKAGKYVPADQVKAHSFKIARRVRDSVMAVPERVSAEVSTMDDPRTIAIYLKEQIALALKDLGDLSHVAKPRS